MEPGRVRWAFRRGSRGLARRGSGPGFRLGGGRRGGFQVFFDKLRLGVKPLIRSLRIVLKGSASLGALLVLFREELEHIHQLVSVARTDR